MNDWLEKIIKKIAELDLHLDKLHFPEIKNFHPMTDPGDFISLLMLIVVILCLLFAQPKN